MWRTRAGVEWSHWNLWFALLCMRDHGGDWDGLDAWTYGNVWRRPHDRLVALLNLDGHCRSAANADGWATHSLAYDLAEAGRLLETGDGPATLAVRRAMLTIGLDLMEYCDDSYGALGDVIGEALEAYAGTDWRSAGVSPRVFWPDFLEIVIMLANYGVVHRREAELSRLSGVAPDLDAVCEVAAGLHADYVAARMTWHADEARVLNVHAIVAAAALDRFETTAQQLGSASWIAEREAMVQAALPTAASTWPNKPSMRRCARSPSGVGAQAASRARGQELRRHIRPPQVLDLLRDVA
jgi:hypothetical protein